MNRVEELRVEGAIQHGDDNASHSNLPNEPTVAEYISIPEAGISLEDHQSHGNPHDQDIVRASGTQNIESGTMVLPDYRRAANTGNHCLFPDCNNIGTLHSVSDKLRSVILSNHKYYVPKLARICSIHLFRNSWDSLYESENSINVFNVEHVQHIFSFVNAFNPTLDFENLQEMDDQIFEYWVGLSKENFYLILEEVPRISEIKSGRLGLVTLLLKLRTGESDERIATLVQKPRRSLEVLMDKVREVLVHDYVPRHLGINHISREQLLGHNLVIPNGIYGNSNNVIVICDGTYIYTNKSSNYMFQKDSYSLHKYRNLLKIFLIVTCDGYIVDCFGPYKATTSDAEIMSSLFRNESSALRFYFRENDIFILDRGFRDSIGLLQECGYRAYMPDSLLEGEHQLTTAQANRSRCVTMCRWVVEVVNGYLKRDFKILRQEYCHRSLPHMMQNVQIAAALLNSFGTRLKNNEYANEILNIINEKMGLENNLANMVEVENMNRRSANFRSLTADRNNVILFPRLEYRDLILFAMGTYQIRQARSYYGEHIRFHGGYRIEVCSERIDTSVYNLRGTGETTLIRGKIKSRHVSRKQYYVYILIENNNCSRSSIVEYCCNCLVGRRTVGCCAHVMTVVWYLGWARHETNIISAPADFLDEIVVRDLYDEE